MYAVIRKPMHKLHGAHPLRAKGPSNIRGMSIRRAPGAFPISACCAHQGGSRLSQTVYTCAAHTCTVHASTHAHDKNTHMYAREPHQVDDGGMRMPAHAHICPNTCATTHTHAHTCTSPKPHARTIFGAPPHGWIKPLPSLKPQAAEERGWRAARCALLRTSAGPDAGCAGASAVGASLGPSRSPSWAETAGSLFGSGDG